MYALRLTYSREERSETTVISDTEQYCEVKQLCCSQAVSETGYSNQGVLESTVSDTECLKVDRLSYCDHCQVPGSLVINDAGCFSQQPVSRLSDLPLLFEARLVSGACGSHQQAIEGKLLLLSVEAR